MKETKPTQRGIVNGHWEPSEHRSPIKRALEWIGVDKWLTKRA